MSEAVVGDDMGNSFEGHLRLPRKERNIRDRLGLDSGGLVDKHHDVVTVSAVIDAGDPRWIRRAGKGDRREQDQRNNNWKRGKDR